MRIIFLIIAVLLLGCDRKHNIYSTSEIAKPKKPLSTVSKHTEIEHVREKYFVGDIDKDGKADTASVIFDRNNEDEVVCEQVNCYIEIKFGRNIPEIKIDQTLGIVVQKTEDLNNDKANEIILFSRTYEGMWNYVSVWSFKNEKWVEIARTKAFISEDNDFKNRLIKEKNQFYLIGDEWNDNKGGVMERNIKVKI